VTDTRSIDIDSIVLQQPPFRFVHRLDSFSKEESIITFTPGDGNLLMENGCLSAAGLIEHMAQANAARIGYYCVYILKAPVDIGYIGQVKDFTFRRLPRAGERLTTTVTLKYEVFKVSLCDVVVRSGEEVLASATLKTAIK
jgi:3-hydroxymyristoyl/3-hydroxydecanoyl-(acyl carrier protein) dehydratase